MIVDENMEVGDLVKQLGRRNRFETALANLEGEHDSQAERFFTHREKQLIRLGWDLAVKEYDVEEREEE